MFLLWRNSDTYKNREDDVMNLTYMSAASVIINLGQCNFSCLQNLFLKEGFLKKIVYTLLFCCCSVVQTCSILWDPMNCSIPDLPVHHQLPEFTQIHVHQVGDAKQPSHPLSSPSPPALNLSQHQGLFQWVSSSHKVAKVLEFQLQHQSFQWIFRTDLL